MIWNLNNSTDFSAAATLVADKEGRDIWLTVVKATFDVAPDGAATPAAVQWPVLYAPLFSGDATRSSLLADSDIDYTKAGVDVLVQGTACAPDGTLVHELVVGLEVEGRRKLLRVHGPRHWCRRQLGIGLSDAEPFAHLPLAYEHAFGGFDPGDEAVFDDRNPAGTGFATDAKRLLDLPAPRIEYDGAPIAHDRARPAGFGPIARHWRPRREFAGTYGPHWEDQRMPLLPLDFDERYFCCAPQDQQFDKLPPQALIRVAGMRPEGVMAFRLPRLALGVNVRVGRQSTARRPSLRTVQVLPDPRQVVLTFADAMPCTGMKYEISDAEVIEKEFIP